MLIVRRIQRPFDFGFDIDQVRAHLRVVGDYDDAAIQDYSNAAAVEFEDSAEIALIHQMVRVVVYGWPSDNLLRLPIGPVLSDETPFAVKLNDQPVDAELIPGMRPRVSISSFGGGAASDQFTIDYYAGFGPVITDVPRDIIHAILDQVGVFYDYRGATPDASKTPQARGTSGLCYAMQRAIGRYRGVRA